MATVSIEKIQLRRGMAADLPGQPMTLSPLMFSEGLDQGEFGYTVDLGRLFLGVGTSLPMPGMANYARTEFPYQNIEVLTENSPLPQIFGGLMCDNQTGFQISMTLDMTVNFLNLQVPDYRGLGEDFYLDLPNGGGVNALIFYFVYNSNGTPLRSGRLTVVWTPAMLYPLCTDEAQSDIATYTGLQFQAALVASGTGQHLVLQYINQTGGLPYIWFNITRPSYDGVWIQPTISVPVPINWLSLVAEFGVANDVVTGIATYRTWTETVSEVGVASDWSLQHVGWFATITERGSALDQLPVPGSIWSDGFIETGAAADSADSIITFMANGVPTQFTIPPVTNALLNTVTKSSAVTLTGFNVPIPIAVSGPSGPVLAINGGAQVTSATLNPGQYFVVQLLSSTAYNASLTATVVAGGVSGGFVVTTITAPLVVPVSLIGYGSTWTEWANRFPTEIGPTAYGNGVFVAMPEYTNSLSAATSYNGTNWTARTLPVAMTWASIAYGVGSTGPLFVAIAGNGVTPETEVVVSSSGVTWSQAALPVSTVWCAIVFGNSKFVAIAKSPDISPTPAALTAYSPDGVHWTQGGSLPAGTWYNVQYGNNLFMATGSNLCATSTDGVTWTPRRSIPAGDWNCLAFGNSTFVALNYNNDKGSNISIYSPDGTNWKSATLPATIVPTNIVFGNGFFVTCSGGVSFTSSDGITWHQYAMPSATSIYTVAAYGNGVFLASIYAQILGPGSSQPVNSTIVTTSP